jgi:hypothetical protein
MGAIPLVVLGYAIFIWNDHACNQDPDVKVHLQNVKNRPSVDALVLGGSNAEYSLSAEDLSFKTGLSWYNASLTVELGTINKYRNFVRTLSARIDRTKVRYVAYSSILPYTIGGIGEAKRAHDEGIKPSRSILQYIAHDISGVFPGSRSSQHNNPGQIVSERQRDSFGDIVFETVKCAFTDNRRPEREDWHERGDEDVSAEFLIDQAIFFTSVFPNASILIVLPSEYYGIAHLDDSIFEQDLRTKFYDLVRQRYHFEGRIKIIFQPPYSSVTQVCDNPRHANEDGRAWRTENLIESIQPIISRHTAFLHGQVNHL